MTSHRRTARVVAQGRRVMTTVKKLDVQTVSYTCCSACSGAGAGAAPGSSMSSATSIPKATSPAPIR